MENIKYYDKYLKVRIISVTSVTEDIYCFVGYSKFSGKVCVIYHGFTMLTTSSLGFFDIVFINLDKNPPLYDGDEWKNFPNS